MSECRGGRRILLYKAIESGGCVWMDCMRSGGAHTEAGGRGWHGGGRMSRRGKRDEASFARHLLGPRDWRHRHVPQPPHPSSVRLRQRSKPHHLQSWEAIIVDRRGTASYERRVTTVRRLCRSLLAVCCPALLPCAPRSPEVPMRFVRVRRLVTAGGSIRLAWGVNVCRVSAGRCRMPPRASREALAACRRHVTGFLLGSHRRATSLE